MREVAGGRGREMGVWPDWITSYLHTTYLIELFNHSPDPSKSFAHESPAPAPPSPLQPTYKNGITIKNSVKYTIYPSRLHQSLIV